MITRSVKLKGPVLTLLLIASAGVILPLGVKAQTFTWRQLGAADFPAKVKAIVFRDGVVLDAQHWVRVGQWRLEFKATAPIATAYSRNENFSPIFSIEGLLCRNPVLGPDDCWMQIGWARQRNIEACFVFPNHRGADVFQINCPVDIHFER
jgi:hypothetical protein